MIYFIEDIITFSLAMVLLFSQNFYICHAIDDKKFLFFSYHNG